MTTCRICLKHGRFETFIFTEKLVGMSHFKFKYFQCSNCGSLGISEIPENLSSFYGQGYYSLSQNLDHKFSKLQKKWGFILATRYAMTGKGFLGKFVYRRYPNYSIQTIHQFPLGTITPSTRLLDIGCGNGELLYMLKMAGCKNVKGLEPNLEESTTYNNGLTIHKGLLKNFKDGGWDVVLMNNSLEHTWHPLETLKLVKGLLSEKGKIIIKIPTPSSDAWDNYGENWVQLDAPRHLNLISREGVHKLKEMLGMKLVLFEDDSTEFQFMGSIQNQEGIPLYSSKSYVVNPKNLIFSAEEILEFKHKAQELNKKHRGDQLYFILAM